MSQDEVFLRKEVFVVELKEDPKLYDIPLVIVEEARFKVITGTVRFVTTMDHYGAVIVHLRHESVAEIRMAILRKWRGKYQAFFV